MTATYQSLNAVWTELADTCSQRIAASEADCLIVWRLDRLARSLA